MREVDHALELAADAAVSDRVELAVDASVVVTPSSGLLVMMRIVPASLDAP